MNKRARAFTLVDFRKQVADLVSPSLWRRMADRFAPYDIRLDPNDRSAHQFIGIVDAMTPAERTTPLRIEGSRIARIARGAGVDTSSVSQVLKYFATISKLQDKLRGRNAPPAHDF